ncbi:Gfo/Idh/MocA family protein [Aureibacillus halotolerans]|uniref:Putative dehydrogenase n=1 Tax=Aureibacillus halotolerans TaxID=1508390 RepID=A0A4R6U2S4_9BACI|nr:Gfo/Idh/MocA family oxidoreductase [Aureibacillus halotolerans]TDQ38685.1 putative dehydrogenase [Aureibacillus halotolerans]
MKFALIGCGHIAKKHADAIVTSESSTLAGVYDTSSETARTFAEQYDTKAYASLDAILNDRQVEGVIIAVPSGFHATIACAAAQHRKHVIVEKPMSITLEDADRMLRECTKHRVKLAVVHPNRFRPAVMEVKRLLDSGAFGRISHVNAAVRWNRNQAYYDQSSWRGTKALDGGVLMNQAIHHLDLLLWLIGPVDSVFSMQATRFRRMEAEDVSTGVLRFADGALGIVEAATTVYPKNLEETLCIFGERGTVKLGGVTANWIEHIDIEGMNEMETQLLLDKIKTDPVGQPGHHAIIEDFVQAVKGGRAPAVAGEDGRAALELVDAFYRSDATQQPITLQRSVQRYASTS